MQARRLINPQFLFHYLLWIFFLVSLISDVYGAFPRSPSRFIIYIISKTSVIAFVVYTNIGLLYPKLFKQRKYVMYVICAILLCSIAGLANSYIENYFNYELLVNTELMLSQSTMAARYLLIAFLLQITVDYYRQKETIKKIEVEKVNAELKFLKAQVNPHFLFNTLNNLYALILSKSDKSAESVLKLADIMKYILAESKEDKVALEKEILLLQNYIDLERLRKSDATISFTVTGKSEGQFVTPLLLLPLVENAFKYGLNTVSKNGFINMSMAITDDGLSFLVENNNPPASNKEALQSMGIGIDNVKKRLELTYPGKYEMTIAEDAAVFRITLQLRLK
jgi:two-component system, LytTR family, sensor kinase